MESAGYFSKLTFHMNKTWGKSLQLSDTNEAKISFEDRKRHLKFVILRGHLRKVGLSISEVISCTLDQFQVKTAATKPRATSSPLVSEEDERISNRAITPGKGAICNSSVKRREFVEWLKC